MRHLTLAAPDDPAVACGVDTAVNVCMYGSELLLSAKCPICKCQCLGTSLGVQTIVAVSSWLNALRQDGHKEFLL